VLGAGGVAYAGMRLVSAALRAGGHGASIEPVAVIAEEPVPVSGLIGGRPVAWVCRAAIVLAIVGVFGTWRNAGAVSLSGVDGPHDGWLVVIFGLIALAGVGALARGSWLGIVTVFGSAAVMIFTAVDNIVKDDSVLGGSSGWGVWLTVVAAVVLAAVAVLAAVRRLRPNTADAKSVSDAGSGAQPAGGG